jgi:hypothetical protein
LPVGPTLADAVRLWWGDIRFFALLAVAVVTPLTVGIELLDHVTGPLEVQVGAVIGVLSLSVLSEVFCAGLAEHVVRRRQQRLPAESVRKLTREIPFLRLAAVSVIVAVVVLCGLVLLIVPGLVAFAWLSLATPLVSLERRSVWSALRGSLALVRGRFWPVAALTTATYLPEGLGDWLSERIERAHAPLWIQVLVEIVTDAVSVSLTAAILVTIFATLGRATGR